MPEDDLCWLEQSHERWQFLNQAITFIESEDAAATQKSYEDFIKKAFTASAFLSVGFEEKSTFKRNLMIGLGSMYYYFFKKKATRKCELFNARPHPAIATTTLNLLDSWLISKVFGMMVPSIKQNLVIYVPRTALHITTDTLGDSGTGAYSLRYVENYIPIRILSSTKLQCFHPSAFASVGSYGSGNGKHLRKFSEIIFHIHGGGFIGMSSKSHQGYTRRWANDLDRPIFSVDYRLAPKYPYPNGLDDVWQAYNWVINNIESLGMSADKIIVTGDSAGGNLSLALVYKCILSGIRVPDGIVVIYPAVNLDINAFCRSYIYALEDGVLPHTFLKLCLNSYMQDPKLNPSNDMFLSPICVSDEIMQQLPRIRIVTGELDPLYDQCIRFIEKLVRARVDVKCDVIKGAPHGALGFYLPGGVKESKIFYDKTVLYFQELLSGI